MEDHLVEADIGERGAQNDQHEGDREADKDGKQHDQQQTPSSRESSRPVRRRRAVLAEAARQHVVVTASERGVIAR
jgi:hypothetical protein